MTLYGIDISHHQSATPPLTGRSFVIARASIGLDRDDRYRQHIANARKAGCVVGAYHFGYTHLSIEAQAETFLAAAGNVDLYAFDVEGDRAPTRDQTQRFIDRVRRAGKACGLYMSQSQYYWDVDTDWRWVAKWSTTPPSRYDIWQYRGAPLDLDRFEGTRTQLLALGTPSAPDTGVTVAGPEFRFADIVEGTVTVKGDGHSLIRTDTGAYVAVPDGQVRQVAGRVVLNSAFGTLPAGTFGWLCGNIPGQSPDKSVAAILLERDGTFTPSTDGAIESLKLRLAAEVARANAAESAVARAKTALGCS